VAGRRARVRRFAKRNRDLIWITTIVQASVLESTPIDAALLVIPGDWSGGNVGFDRATVLGIRGWLNISQATVGTSADATGAYAAIYLTDAAVATNSMDPSDAAEYAIFDVLYTDGVCINATSAGPAETRQVNVKARRKITSAQSVRLAFSLDADTASPRCNINGVLRTLLQLDAQ